jgi:hypothetical protein
MVPDCAVLVSVEASLAILPFNWVIALHPKCLNCASKSLTYAPSVVPAPIAANFFAALHAVSDDIRVEASDSPAGA